MLYLECSLLMAISDPSHILQRIPELHALTDDAKIRHAIESGDPFKVYRALVLAKLFNRLPADIVLLRQLTAERRLFARPLKSSPTLGTINSVGFSFVGNAETDAEGYYIALHAFVILFAIPLIPFGAYVVQSTGANSWRIYARAPLGIFGWLYTRGLALALVLLVLAGAAGSLNRNHYQELTILNGFKIPLNVSIDQQTVVVPAQGKIVLTVKTGIMNGVATSRETGEIDHFTETLQRSSRYSIWNIAGAAPLIRGTVVYQAKTRTGANTADAADDTNIYCGTRFIEFGFIDYAFTEPPKTISTKQTSGSISRTRLDVINESQRSQLKLCSDYLFEHGQEKLLAKALEVEAQLQNWDLSATGQALAAAKKVSPAEALRLVNRARDAHPDDITWTRIYRDLREGFGQHQALLDEFGARAKAQPDSADAQYLYTSLLTGKEGLNAMQVLARRFPGNAPILASLAWRKTAHGDYAGALQDMKRLHQLAPSDAERILDTEVQILLALHRAQEALQLLDLALRNKTSISPAIHATQFAQIAQQLGGNPQLWLTTEMINDPGYLDFFRVRANLPPLQDKNRLGADIKLQLALQTDPELALALAKQAPQQLLERLNSEQLVLLLGETLQNGNHKGLVTTLTGALNMSPEELQLLQQFITGEQVTLEQGDFELPLQAAALLARSRNRQLGTPERVLLRERAGKADLLHGLVSHAVNQWPM